MSRYRFSAIERYAVYSVHGEKCYLCHLPLYLKSMEVDHIIPESLSDDPARLAAVLDEFGLPADFNLNSYGNWMPACGPCNSAKREMIFSQGQRQLTPVCRKDFEHELWIPATRASFHDQASFTRVLLEERKREAIQPGNILACVGVPDS